LKQKTWLSSPPMRLKVQTQSVLLNYSVISHIHASL
jgi:hypothetical protein